MLVISARTCSAVCDIWGVVTQLMCIMCVTYLDCWRCCGVGEERLLEKRSVDILIYIMHVHNIGL